MPTSKAEAIWEGAFKSGNGTYKGASGITGKYTFASRFETGGSSNPEELLAGAEAACFSMALTAALDRNGTTPTSVKTEAACTFEKVGEGFSITTIKLVVQASVPGIEKEAFDKIAAATKDGCPVSRALKGNVNIELDAQLV